MRTDVHKRWHKAGATLLLGRRVACVLALSGLPLSPALLCPAPLHAEPVANPYHQWDASLDDGLNTIWEDTGVGANQHWSLSGFGGPNPAGPQRVAVSSTSNLTHAYQFDGVYDRGRAAAENREGDHNATFELWFRPAGIPTDTAWPIFENGNEPRGLTVGLAGDLLVFVYAAGHDTHADVTYDLDVDDNGLDNLDFIHAVAVVDDANDELRLYVDGSPPETTAVGVENDYTSNNDWGLGRNNDNGGGQADSPYDWGGIFAGEIAILREYRTAFTQAEVEQNYRSIVGAAVTADFDGDGYAAGSDLLIWQRGFGSDAGLSGGDADLSGVVDGNDLQIWQGQFGTLAPGTSASVVGVPVPGGGALTWAAIATLSVWARRRR